MSYFESPNQSKQKEEFHDEVQPFSLSDDDKKDPQIDEIEQKRENNPLDSRPGSNWLQRPQSKPNLVERLENEANLDEFEQKEREILRQIEDERHQSLGDVDFENVKFDNKYTFSTNDHHQLDVIDEEPSNIPSLQEDTPVDVPDSVQNRQLSSNIRSSNSVETTLSDESDDYPKGFSVQATSVPPPAYTTDPTTTRGQLDLSKQVQPNEKLLRSEDITSPSSRHSSKIIDHLNDVLAQQDQIATVPAETSPRINFSRSGRLLEEKMNDETSHSSDEVEHFDVAHRISEQQHSQAIAKNPTYRLSNDIKELFHYVEEFTADRIEIQPILRPFFLDYIPAVGDVDPFLKIPRPDQIDDHLGLIVLDEPATTQSDPTIVDMKLRQLSNAVSKPADAPVKKLDRADKNQQHIENWIRNIKELRRSKPPDRVAYSRQMPDLEKLMQEWPTEVDVLLQNSALLSAKLDCSLKEYVDLCLALVDIPVHKNRIYALHLLFSLYAEFRNSQHFHNIASNNSNLNFKYGDTPKTADRLEL